MKTCQDCKFFATVTFNSKAGECRRNPPVLFYNFKKDTFVTALPDVKRNCPACGEFKRRWWK